VTLGEVDQHVEKGDVCKVCKKPLISVARHCTILYDIAAWRSQLPPQVADGRMRNRPSIASA
jgi:hypothetical protein